MRSERDANLTYIMRADHEFYCTNTAPVNHKVPADSFNANMKQVILQQHQHQRALLCFENTVCPSQIHLRHEESLSHIKSSLDMSYGKHWDEINNRHTLLLSQSFKNQSTENHTSYALEVTCYTGEASTPRFPRAAD